MTKTQPTIFVLGFGSIGALLAAQLQKRAQANVIPLLRSKQRLAEFQKYEYKAKIRSIFKEGHPELVATFPNASCPDLMPSECKIDNLIITTKTYQTKEAMAPYMKYIHPDTNIILVQNGLGVFEVLQEEVFLDFSPNLFQGVISHGAFHDTGFTFNHAGFADLKIARLPVGKNSDIVQSLSLVREDAENNELMKAFCEPQFVESLAVKHLTYQEMLLGQLEKFLVNACINPITSIVDCINGELKTIAGPIFESIITEALAVLKIAYKPLFDYTPKNSDFPALDVTGTLDASRMLEFIIRIGCIVNDDNSSSMRQDVLNLRDTEIQYINGFIVRLCEKLGLPSEQCKVNQSVETLVNLRLGLNRTRDQFGDKRKK